MKTQNQTQQKQPKRGRPAKIPWNRYSLMMANQNIPDVKIVQTIWKNHQSDLKGGVTDDEDECRKQIISLSVNVGRQRKRRGFLSKIQKKRAAAAGKESNE